MKTYYTISEVSEIIKLPKSTIRYYSNEFSSSFTPKNKYQRKYTNGDIGTLIEIAELSRVCNHVGINEVLQGKIKIEFL